MKPPQTTADSMTSTVETRQSCLIRRLDEQSQNFRHSPSMCGSSVDLGHYVPWAKRGLSPFEAVLPTDRISKPSFQLNFPLNTTKIKCYCGVQTWRPGNCDRSATASAHCTKPLQTPYTPLGQASMRQSEMPRV